MSSSPSSPMARACREVMNGCLTPSLGMSPSTVNARKLCSNSCPSRDL